MEPQNRDMILSKGKIKPSRPGQLNNERMARKKSSMRKLKMMTNELVEGPDIEQPPRTSKSHRQARRFVRNDTGKKFPEAEWRNGPGPGPRSGPPWNGDRRRHNNFPGSPPAYSGSPQGSPERRRDMGRERIDMRHDMGPSHENFLEQGRIPRNLSPDWCDDESRFPRLPVRQRMMHISRSPSPERFGPPHVSQFEYIGPPRGPNPEHFGPPRRQTPEHIGPPRRPHHEHFGPPRRTSPGHNSPPRRPHLDQFVPPRRVSPEYISPPRRPHHEQFGPPRRLSPGYNSPPRRPHPDFIGPPRRPSPEHVAPSRSHYEHFDHPRQPSPEHIGPSRRPPHERFGSTRRSSSDQFDLTPSERFGPSRGPSPGHFGLQREMPPEDFGPFSPIRAQPENFGPHERPSPENFGPPQGLSPEYFGSSQRPPPENFGPPRRQSPIREDCNARFIGPRPHSPDIDDRPRMNRRYEHKPGLSEHSSERMHSMNEQSPDIEKWTRFSDSERSSHSPEPVRSRMEIWIRERESYNDRDFSSAEPCHRRRRKDSRESSNSHSWDKFPRPDSTSHEAHHPGSVLQDIDERQMGPTVNPVQMELSSSRSPSPEKGASAQTENTQPTHIQDGDKVTKESNSGIGPQMFLPGNPVLPTNPMDMMMACQASAWFPPMAMAGFGAYPFYSMANQQQIPSQMFGWANYYYVGQPTLPMVPPLPETPTPQNPPAPPESPTKQGKPEQSKRKTETVHEQPKQKVEPVKEKPNRIIIESMKEQGLQRTEQKDKKLVRKRLKKAVITRPWILLNDESSQNNKEIVSIEDSDSDKSYDQDSSVSSSEDSVKHVTDINVPGAEIKEALGKVRANVSEDEEFIDDFNREKLLLEATKVKKVGLNHENRVVFVPWNYPEACLSAEQENELAGQLVSKLDAIKPGSDFEPIFESYFVSRGAFVLNCGNGATKIWAKQLATDLSVTGVNLLIATGPEIPSLNVKVGGFFPGEKLASSLVLSILRNENPSLLIENWSLVEQIRKRDGFFAIMEIPKTVARNLEACDFQIKYKKHKVTLKFLSDNNLQVERQHKFSFDTHPVRSEHRRSNLILKDKSSLYPHQVMRSSRSPRRIPRDSERRRNIEASRRRRTRSPPRRRISSPRRWR